MSAGIINPEHLVDSFLRKISLAGLSEARNKKARIVLDYGLPHRPSEHNLRICRAQLIRLDKERAGTFGNDCMIGFELDGAQVQLVAYLKEDGSFHLNAAENRLPCQHVRVVINDVDLGWFCQTKEI